MFQVDFSDLSSSSQQHILDLVAIYRCLLDLEPSVDRPTSETTVSEPVTDQTKDIVMKTDNRNLPDIVKDVVNTSEQRQDGAAWREQDGAAMLEQQQDGAVVLEQHQDVGHDADDEDESSVDKDELETVVTSCGGQLPTDDCLLPDLVPRTTLSGAPNLPDIVPRQKRSISVQQPTYRTFQIVRGDESEQRLPVRPVDGSKKETWRNIGRQLNLISANLGDNLNGNSSLVGARTVEEEEEEIVRRPRREEGRKFLTDLAVSVVANTIIYVCLKKLKRLIF